VNTRYKKSILTLGLIFGASSALDHTPLLWVFGWIVFYCSIIGILYVNNAFGSHVKVNVCKLILVILILILANVTVILCYFVGYIIESVNPPPSMGTMTNAPPMGSLIFGLLSLILLAISYGRCLDSEFIEIKHIPNQTGVEEIGSFTTGNALSTGLFFGAMASIYSLILFWPFGVTVIFGSIIGALLYHGEFWRYIKVNVCQLILFVFLLNLANTLVIMYFLIQIAIMLATLPPGLLVSVNIGPPTASFAIGLLSTILLHFPLKDCRNIVQSTND